MLKVLISILTVALVACKYPNDNKNDAYQEQNQILIGKKALLIYPELKANVSYVSENKIHWKTTDLKGNTAEQTNELTYKRIGANLFFLNWIEDDGTTVSQIIDIEKEKVTAYLTYTDENVKRVFQLLEGKFELEK